MYEIDNPEGVPSRAKESIRRWRDSHVVFLVLPAFCIFLIPLGGLLYLFGRLSFHPLLGIWFLYPASGVFMIYCFVAGVWRLFSGWKRHTRMKKTLITVEIAIPVVFVLLFVLPFSGLCRLPLWPASPHICGFRDRIKSKADIPAIRDWLKTLDKDYYILQSNRPPREKWPKSLKALTPAVVDVASDKNGNPFLQIVDGGGFEHWGAAIGFQDFVISESDLKSKYYTWLLVEPGVYVYAW